MVRQLTALLHISANHCHASASGNALHARGVKLFAVIAYYQLKKTWLISLLFYKLECTYFVIEYCTLGFRQGF